MGQRSRPVVLGFLLIAALDAALAIRAALAPPRGTVFVGTFYYVDDFYNYLSYVEQAQRGALVFRNKLADPSLPPSLVNLEWLAVGWLSALLGGHPLLAYRLFGLAALAALAWSIDRWLVRSGLPTARRTAGLLLALTGGGLGGVLFVLGKLPGHRALDLRTGAFPFVEAVANPHFVAGTALLLAALGAFAAGRARRGAALGCVLGLVRPYDAALLAGVEGLAVLTTVPRAQWPRRLLPLLAIAPVLAYDAWLFLASAGFSVFRSPHYAAVAPAPGDLAPALGPAAVLALLALRLGRDEPGGAHRVRLALWATVALLVVLLRPVSFSLQLVVGIGAPLLILGAVGLARLPGRALEAAIPLMAANAAVVTWLCTLPSPSRFVPADRWRAVIALREVCRPGDVIVAPEDIGLYAGGLAPCWPFVSHPAASHHAARAAAVRRFYSEASAAERTALLDRACATHVLLPSAPPARWIDSTASFRQVSTSSPTFAVWSRDGPAVCAGRRW